MINDGIIKEIVSVLNTTGWLEYNQQEDYGYKIKYRANPTVVSTNTESFVLNGTSEIDKIHGQYYVDRVYISKDASRAEVSDLMIEMIKAFRKNELMKGLNINFLSFQMPGYVRYLREVESNPHVYELRLAAKGYPHGI